MLTCQKIEAFQARFVEVEQMFLRGRITPQERLRRLEAARDESGFGKGFTNAEVVIGTTQLAHMTEDEFRERSRANRLRWAAARAARKVAAPMRHDYPVG